MKKLKDLDLEVAVDKKISELKKLSTKKVQSMTVCSKFVSENANKKHSGSSSQDADVEEAAVISAPAENSPQSLSSSSDPPTESSQAASTSDEKAKTNSKT